MTDFAPGFLLAPPSLMDPNFDRSVVLLASHEDGGATGFIINRPGRFQLHALLDDLSLTPTIKDRDVLIGGPVQSFSGFVLYEHPAHRPAGPGMSISPTISISPSRDVLEQAVQGRLHGRFELLLGYAGWGAGQLDDEIASGGWLPVDFDPELLFDVDVDARWDELYARLGIDPGEMISVPGGAQA